MKDNIRMGIKDILGNKLLFASAIVLILILNIVAVMTTITIHSDFYEKEMVETQDTTKFNIVPTEYNIHPKSDFFSNYINILENNAVTFRMSNSLTQEAKTFVFLVFGDGSIVNKSIPRSDDITVYAYDPLELQGINVLDTEYPINYIDYSTHDRTNFGEIGSDSILVVFGGRAGAETINTLSPSLSNIF